MIGLANLLAGCVREIGIAISRTQLAECYCCPATAGSEGTLSSDVSK